MGAEDISNAKSAGDVVDQNWFNLLRGALKGVFLPRDASTGVVTTEREDIGSALYPWGTVYADFLNVGGSIIDFGMINGEENGIISGKTRSNSAFPDFLRASGTTNSVTLQAASTNLVLNIAGTGTTYTSDITETGLTTATSSNNTALINDATLTGAFTTRHKGEDDTSIIIDAAGSEITSRVGQYVTFKVGSEYFIAYVKSSTELLNCYRGFFFDSSGNPISRSAISDNDMLTLMSTGWVFAEDDATTIDVSYKTPIFSNSTPSTPTTGDYFYDMVNQLWKRYDGSSFVTVNRILVGIVVIDGTACVATRCMHFDKNYLQHTVAKVKYLSAARLIVGIPEFDINVYGVNVPNKFTPYQWDITTDLESGLTETASRTYYAYVSETGKPVLSDIKPYNNLGELQGWYHPHNSWRAVASVDNDASSNFTNTSVYNYYADNAVQMSEQGLNFLRAMDRNTAAADKILYFTSALASATTTLTSYMRTLLDDVDAAAARTTLALGNLAVMNESDFRATGSSGSFSGSGTATLTTTLPTGYTTITCFLNDIVSTSGTGSPSMTFAVSYDSGSTWSAEFSLGSDSTGNTNAIRCLGKIEIGPRYDDQHQYIHYFTTGADWNGVGPTVTLYSNALSSTGPINRIRLTVTGLTGGMASGTITYLAVK
jgi:hypothetical protein